MKRMLKKVSVLLCLSLIISVFTACDGGNSPSAEVGDNGFEKITIRYGNPYNEETSQGQALNYFKELVEEGSGGNITVDIFHGGTLGSEQNHIQAQKDGSIEMLFSGTAGIGLYVPELAVLESFFAFDSNDELNATLDSVWTDIDQAMQDEGFKLLGVFNDASTRQILSSTPINSFEDASGLKMRTPSSPIYIECITALGMQSVTMPLGDVYTSLQTNAIAAMEGTIDIVRNQKFFEQAKYYIETEHVFPALYVTYNLDAWNNLSENTQVLIADAVEQSVSYQNELSEKNLNESIEFLKEAGIEFIQIEDRDVWREAVKDTAKKYASEQGPLGETIFANIPKLQ
ncbi:TRAP transporter substrate-binding protein [Agathobaculum sp. TL06]